MNQKNIIIVAIVVLALAGGGYYLWSKLPTQQAAKNKEAVDNVKVEDLKMKINLSPMPELSLSSFALVVPQLAGLNIFSGVSINSDFSYQGETKLSAPSYDLSVSVPAGGAPASAPSGGNSAPAATPTGAPAQTGAPAGQATDCAQFTSVPSCSMVGGGQAEILCKQCFPNK